MGHTVLVCACFNCRAAFTIVVNAPETNVAEFHLKPAAVSPPTRVLLEY